MKRILIDIGHPAHVHLFRHFAQEMQNQGHQVLFTSRDKEYVIYLLEHFGFQYKCFGSKYTSTIGKLWGLIKFDIKEMLVGIKFKPDIFLSHGSMYAAHAAFFLNKPHISFEDTFNFEQVRLYKPFTKVILTANYDHPLKSSKVIKYAGYHELAYLYSNYFTPNKEILKDLGVAVDEKYVIMRFVAWNASHDKGQKGISLKYKKHLVSELSKLAKVFISSEGELPNDLLSYKINIPPHKMHDALAYATLFVGEGATMASECAMLGTPAIYVNTLNAVTIVEQEKYGLISSYRSNDGVLQKANELLQMPNLKEEFQSRRMKMLEEKIDLTAFMVWFVENWPESRNKMKAIPEYYEKFKIKCV